MGIVYNPFTGDLVHAHKGQGAFSGNSRLFLPTEKTQLTDAVICSDWGGSENDDDTIRRGIQNLERLILNCRSVVVHFSPALDLCQIAMGRMDALVTLSTEVEDHAAGALIVQEAGGVVSNFGSKTWDFRMRGIVTANAELHLAIKALLE
jgi:myo-inositol-1(or 4)-monophosphatase